ncbi:hypothetical protein DFH09DRAFT_1271311 [Mycena vulgaris]|nr:hypothetical protein DFH09DRAFT_1271311 [Mycena vulgaris]
MPSTHDTAIIQSPLIGDIKGIAFNDIANVVGTGNVSINTEDPIREITVMHGEVIDGLKIVYDKASGTASSTTSVTHGTSIDSKDTALKKVVISLEATENIIAVTGMHGDVPPLGIRVAQLTFVIYDSSTGRTRIAGPYGSKSAKAFYITADGNFVAFGGYAVDTDDSIAQATVKKQDGGLYGLTFSDVAYRSI